MEEDEYAWRLSYLVIYRVLTGVGNDLQETSVHHSILEWNN